MDVFMTSSLFLYHRFDAIAVVIFVLTSSVFITMCFVVFSSRFSATDLGFQCFTLNLFDPLDICHNYKCSSIRTKSKSKKNSRPSSWASPWLPIHCDSSTLYQLVKSSLTETSVLKMRRWNTHTREENDAEMRNPNACVMFESFCIHLLHHAVEKSAFDRKPQFGLFSFPFFTLFFHLLVDGLLLFQQNAKEKVCMQCKRFNLQCKVRYISTALTPFSFEFRRNVVFFIFRNSAHTKGDRFACDALPTFWLDICFSCAPMVDFFLHLPEENNKLQVGEIWIMKNNVRCWRFCCSTSIAVQQKGKHHSEANEKIIPTKLIGEKVSAFLP